MTALLSSPSNPGTDSPDFIIPSHSRASVGAGAKSASAVSDEELEIHIEDAQHQYLMAYERFQLHGNPHDRDEALLHLHRMNQALLARSPALQAQRHAEFEDRLSQGLDFFNSDYAAQLGREIRSAAA